MANSMIFVNLSVADLPRSRAFFEALGFSFNPQFTNDQAACMVVSPHIYAMLLVPSHFAGFTPKPIADAHACTEALVALSCDSREEVDRLCGAAFAAGGRRYKEPQDLGFMYGWGFEDPDGHLWELFWMDPAHVQA